MKKGLSTVVATILIMLISIISIVLIWQALRPTIKNSVNSIDANCIQLDLDLDRGNTDCSTDPVKVGVKLGTIPVTKLVFSFENEGSSKNIEITDVPSTQTRKTYSFNKADIGLENVNKINIGAHVQGQDSELNCGFVYSSAVSC